jgi:hypothetical protein
MPEFIVNHLFSPIQFALQWSSKMFRRRTERRSKQHTYCDTATSHHTWFTGWRQTSPRDVGLHTFSVKKQTTAVSYLLSPISDLAKLQKIPPDDKQISLQDLLNVDGIIAGIARHVHYVDLLNLASASRSTYDAVFRPASPAAKPINPKTSGQTSTRSELLCVRSCVNGTKSKCWSCNAQICAWCVHIRSLQDTDTAGHITDCVPYCSKCYRTKVCSESRSLIRLERCSCKAVQAASSPSVSRGICRLCFAKSSAANLAERALREKAEITHLAGQASKCVSCDLPVVSRGPRWWCCQRCWRECREDCHPSFWAVQ